MQTVGRNDPCPCGSGKKFKHCHGALAGAAPTEMRRARTDAAAAQEISVLLERGIASQRAGRFSEAERAYQAVLQSEPNHSLALEYLGVLALHVGNPQAALPLLRRAIEADPSRATTHFNCGGALLALHRLKDAAACFERALSIDAHLVEAHHNLGNIYKYFDIERAIHCYREAVRLRPDDAALHSNLLVCMHYTDEFTHEQLFAEHIEWGRRHAPTRLVIVSPNFTGMVIGHFLRGLFAAIDQSRYQLYCYSSTVALDALGEELRSRARVWRDFSSLDDDATASLIRNDRIDILVDLSGHTQYNRLRVLARKAARRPRMPMSNALPWSEPRYS